MTNYAAARLEITKPAYNGMTPEQIAAAVNLLPIVSSPRGINPVEVRNALILTPSNDWGWLRGVADGWITSANASGAGAVAVVTTPAGTGGATRRAARAFVDLLSGDAGIPLTSADATLLQSATDLLISANVMTAAAKTKIVALAKVDMPQWQAWDFSEAWTAETVLAVQAWRL